MTAAYRCRYEVNVPSFATVSIRIQQYQRRMKKTKRDTKLRLDQEAVRALTGVDAKDVVGGTCDMGTVSGVPTKPRARTVGY
jgi:hypothetical protein